MAFGGLATGNMKANEDARTPGNIKYSGFLLSFPDCKAIMTQELRTTETIHALKFQ